MTAEPAGLNVAAPPASVEKNSGAAKAAGHRAASGPKVVDSPGSVGGNRDSGGAGATATEPSRQAEPNRWQPASPAPTGAAAKGARKTPSAAEGPDAIDRVRLVQRVARSFQRLGPAGGQLNLLLHPAELGSVRLQLSLEGSRMEASITTQTTAALEVLRDQLPELRQRLADFGIEIERIDFRQADPQDGGAMSGREGQQQGTAWEQPRRSQQPPGYSAPRRTAPAGPESAAVEGGPPTPPRDAAWQTRGIDLQF
jgi:flagellar hook-length control protein FliK